MFVFIFVFSFCFGHVFFCDPKETQEITTCNHTALECCDCSRSIDSCASYCCATQGPGFTVNPECSVSCQTEQTHADCEIGETQNCALNYYLFNDQLICNDTQIVRGQGVVGSNPVTQDTPICERIIETTEGFRIVITLDYAHLPGINDRLDFDSIVDSNSLNLGYYRGCSTSGCNYEGHIKFMSIENTILVKSRLTETSYGWKASYSSLWCEDTPGWADSQDISCDGYTVMCVGGSPKREAIDEISSRENDGTGIDHCCICGGGNLDQPEENSTSNLVSQEIFITFLGFITIMLVGAICWWKRNHSLIDDTWFLSESKVHEYKPPVAPGLKGKSILVRSKNKKKQRKKFLSNAAETNGLVQFRSRISFFESHYFEDIEMLDYASFVEQEAEEEPEESSSS